MRLCTWINLKEWLEISKFFGKTCKFMTFCYIYNNENDKPSYRGDNPPVSLPLRDRGGRTRQQCRNRTAHPAGYRESTPRRSFRCGDSDGAPSAFKSPAALTIRRKHECAHARHHGAFEPRAVRLPQFLRRDRSARNHFRACAAHERHVLQLFARRTRDAP